MELGKTVTGRISYRDRAERAILFVRSLVSPYGERTGNLDLSFSFEELVISYGGREDIARSLEEYIREVNKHGTHEEMIRAKLERRV